MSRLLIVTVFLGACAQSEPAATGSAPGAVETSPATATVSTIELAAVELRVLGMT